MPKKSKREKKAKKGKNIKLSDKDLIKLLKKLKPQTQQVVRVNVGDQDKKKKKAGEVQASYNPPFVFPSQGYPAIINLGQAPPPSAPIPQAVQTRAPLPESQQPQLQNWIREPPLLLTDVETDVENIKIKRKSKKREEEMRQGYSVSEPRFTKPKTRSESRLGEQSSQSFRITELPSMNDPYMPVEIQTNKDADQVGNLASSIPSEEWSLSPDGNVLSVEEMQQQKMIQQPLKPEESSEELLAPEKPLVKSSATIMEEVFSSPAEEVFSAPVEIQPTQEEMKNVKEKKTFLKPKKNQIISDLTVAISTGELSKEDLPAEFFNKKGGAVGKLKESLAISALQPYWEDLYKKRQGQSMGTSNY